MIVEKSQFAWVQPQGKVTAILLASVLEMPPTKNTPPETFSKALHSITELINS
jgi:hypothetical protein